MEDGDKIAAQAHRIAEERSYSPERFLAILDRGAYYDYEIWRLPASQRDILLPPLRAMARERDGTVRLNAAYALLQLNDPAGRDVIVACLKEPQTELRKGALERLWWLGLRNYEREQNLPSATGSNTILVGLATCLTDPNPRIRQRAVELMSQLSTPPALDLLTQLLGAADWVVRTEAAICLGLAGLDRGALAILDELLHQSAAPLPLQGHLRRHMFVKGIEQLCSSIDPDVSTRAAEVATRFVRGNLTGGNEIANHVWNLLRGISAAQASYELELLREVLTSKMDYWVRGVALERLAELSGKDGIKLLLSAMPDPELREAALEGLTALMLKSSDPQVMELLGQEISRESSEDISKLVKAYLAAGGRAIEVLDSIASRVEPDIAVTIHWLRSGLTPRKAAKCLRPVIVGRGPTEEKLSELEAEWTDRPNAINATFAILDRLAVFIFKTVDGTVDHAEVVIELAEITEHRFVVEDVVQTVESEDELRIRFIHNGAGYMFSLRDHGRYINLDDVLAGLNGVLERLDFAERFIHIEIGDVAAVVVFVRAEAFFAAAETLRIPLKTDREAARLPPLPL